MACACRVGNVSGVRLVFVALPALLFALPPLAFSQTVDPIATRNHRALSLAFLRLQPRGLLLTERSTELAFGWTLANDLRLARSPGSPTIEEDYEVSRLGVTVRRGLSPALEGFLEASLIERGGGSLDAVIDWWHRNVLFWTDPLRDESPRGRSLIALPDGSRFGSAAGLGDITAGLSGRFRDDWLWTFAMKIPTGNATALLGSGGWDVGIALQRATSWGDRWSWGTQFGAVWQGPAKALRDSRRWVDQEALWLGYRYNSRTDLILQWQSEASALRSGIPASDAAHRLVTFGYRRRIADGQWLDVFISEDRDLPSGAIPEIANTGPDFTIGFVLRIRK